MKKALNISVAGTLFTIEDDAYAKLDGYISSIKAHFAHAEGKDEIVKDIEARIAEKLLDTGKQIISLPEVEAIISSMGKVEDFGDGIREGGKEDGGKTKKLYRNSDDTVVAGVCSGLGKYFGVDPLWIRLAFVVFTFILNGFTFLLYIILWIVVPQAKTAAQKLEMEGTPVTLETLSENVKEKVAEMDQKHGSTFRRIASFPFVILKKIVSFIRKAIFPLIRGILGVFIATISLAAVLALSFIGPYLIASPERLADFPIADAIPAFVITALVASAYLVLAIPAAFAFLLAISLLRKKLSFDARLGYSLLGLWIFAIMAAGASGATALSSYEDYERTSPIYETVSRDMPIGADVRSLVVAHGQRVRLVQDDTTSLVATGRQKDIDRLLVETEDGDLRISTRPERGFCIFCDRRAPEITLTLPAIERIEAEHGSRIESESWSASAPLEIGLRYGSRADLEIVGPETDAAAEHGSRLTLRGASEKASFKAGFGSEIRASEFSAKDAAASAEFGSTIRVQATLTLDAAAEHGSSIIYSGTPQVTERAENGSDIRPESN